MFLKQPRRGKTHEVQLTPHKRSAVWGQPQDKRSAVWGSIAEWDLSAVRSQTRSKRSAVCGV